MIEDQRPGQTATVSHTERRRNSRIPIRRLGYVNLEPYDNGGVITDISRDGLRFHMVNPVEQGGLVRLSILLGGVDPLQVVGEIIWMDATRRNGGVRFTMLPDGAADGILNWAEALNSADALKSGVSRPSDATNGASQANPTSPEPGTAAITDHASARPTANISGPPPTPAQAVPEVNVRSPWAPPSARPYAGAVGPTSHTRARDLPNPLSNPGTVLPQPWMSPVGNQQPTAMPWITHFDPDPPGQRSSIFVRGVLGGIIFCVLLGSAAWFGLRHYGSQNGAIPFIGPLASQPVAPSPVASGLPAPQHGLAPADLTSNGKASDVNAANSQQPEQARSAALQEASPSARPNVQPNRNLQPDPDAGSADTSAAEPKAAPAPAGSASSQKPSPQPPIAESAPATTLTAKSGSAEPGPQQIAKAPASQLPPAADTGESQLMLARQYLDGHAHPRNPMVASQLLWSAVEKGNSTAEMDLADLYLRGDGVARNCDQARVLLSVASGKGNPEAMQKLSELNRTGCR